MVVLSNGKLVSEDKEPGSGLVGVRWLQDKPHVNYLIALAAGHLKKIEDKFKEIPIALYTPASQIDYAKNTFKDLKDMLGFFEEEIGVPYPWAKYYQVCVDDFHWGGMENTTLTVLNDRTLHPDEFENLRSSQGLIAHELAHQWFGDLVTCKDWAHLWLNEGFATFMATLWQERRLGADDASYSRWRSQANWMRQARVFEEFGVWYDALRIASELIKESPSDADAKAGTVTAVLARTDIDAVGVVGPFEQETRVAVTHRDCGKISSLARTFGLHMDHIRSAGLEIYKRGPRVGVGNLGGRDRSWQALLKARVDSNENPRSIVDAVEKIIGTLFVANQIGEALDHRVLKQHVEVDEPDALAGQCLDLRDADQKSVGPGALRPRLERGDLFAVVVDEIEGRLLSPPGRDACDDYSRYAIGKCRPYLRHAIAAGGPEQIRELGEVADLSRRQRPAIGDADGA
jgi:hypothetical protein